MSIWQRLAEESRQLHVLQVMFVMVIAYALVRVGAVQHARRFRLPLGATAIYLVFVPVVAYLRAVGSPSLDAARLVALCFGTLAEVGAGGVLLFGVAETQLRLKVPRIVSDLVLAFVSVAAVSVVASRMGVNLSSLLATSAVITAVIGLSLQDTLGNMVAGITLQLDSSIRIGDWVKIGDLSGRVSEIRWRFTAIETRNWETVIVPNAQLIKGQVIVLGKRTGASPQWRRWVYFNVDFRYPPSHVVDVVQEALCREPIANVSSSPPPQCILFEICDSYYRFAARYWLLDFAVDDPTDSVVRMRIVNALKRIGVSLSIPAKALFVTNDTAERREDKLRRETLERANWLRRVSLFNCLSAEEVARLATGLSPVPFASGEVLTRQGAEAHWLYIVVAGQVSVRVQQGELEREVARLGEGQFFGEMGLLTGEARTATVVAVEDVQCFRLGKSAFHDLLQDRPEIADEVARELARRRIGLIEARDDLDAESRQEVEHSTAAELLRRMRAFFAMA